MLRYPDMNAPFILSTDVSGTALGYILGQKGPDGKERIKFTVSGQECIAGVDDIKAYNE